MLLVKYVNSGKKINYSAMKSIFGLFFMIIIISSCDTLKDLAKNIPQYPTNLPQPPHQHHLNKKPGLLMKLIMIIPLVKTVKNIIPVITAF